MGAKRLRRWARSFSLLALASGTPSISRVSLRLPVAVLKFGDGLGVQSCPHDAKDACHPSISRDLGFAHHVAHVVRHLVLPMVPKLTPESKSGEVRHTDTEVMVSPRLSMSLCHSMLTPGS